MISFIVPAHNEEFWIGRCLEAIDESMRAVERPHEIIVVDDASTDTTAAIAEQHGARVIHVAHRNIAATRNSGAREARGDLFIFVDADTLVNQDVVREAIEAVARGAAGGGCVPTFEGGIPLWCRVIYPFVVFAMRHVLNQTGGACLFSTRAVFEATGGFSEAHFAAEEDVWVKALKKHGRFVIPQATILTSGRSLRSNSLWAIGRLMLRLTFRGADGFRSRRGLDTWYRPTREK
ncbi:MAG TPA: glycosyltransferase [Prosthecobacter sp.]|nr:glycosyltransferase [Prosthecobacter sp.]